MDNERIANLLRQAIADRQVLAIGRSDAAIADGNVGLFATSLGNINATAVNFCYGDCLLFKVDGQWFALNNDPQQIVNTTVNRQIRSRPKPPSRDPILAKFIGINDFGNPRKIIYDFDINLTELGAENTPPIEPNFFGVYLDNLLNSSDETELGDDWSVVGFNPNTPFLFFAIDSVGNLTRYVLSNSEQPINGVIKYIGHGKFFSRISQNDGVNNLPSPYSNLAKMRFYSSAGIETGIAALQDYSLQQPTVDQLWGYSNPAEAIATRPQITLGDYYYDATVGTIEFNNAPNGASLGGGLTGIITVSYPVLSRFTNSKLPLIIGQKTLSRVASLDPLPIDGISERVYTSWNPGTLQGTLISSRTYSMPVYNNSELSGEDINFQGLSEITYDLDGLSIGLSALNDYSYLNSSVYTLMENTISFLSGLGSYSQERIRSTLSANNVITSTTYDTNPVYTSHQNARVAIVTDRIQNCQYTSIQIQEIVSSPQPEQRRYKTVSATYTELIPDSPNPTSLRGLFFISAILFDPEYTTIVNSPDCYAKFYRTFVQNNQLFALEFWVLEDGNVYLYEIHDRETLPGEVIFANRSCLYYPEVEEE